MADSKEKPWQGRFSGETSKLVEEFTSSLHFDRRLYRYDIAGSMAHARMLGKQGILTAAEVEAMVSGLERVRGEIDRGEFVFEAADEDIHMAVERRLTGAGRGSGPEAAHRPQPQRSGGPGYPVVFAGSGKRFTGGPAGLTASRGETGPALFWSYPAGLYAYAAGPAGALQPPSAGL